MGVAHVIHLRISKGCWEKENVCKFGNVKTAGEKYEKIFMQ
jgi:hypothetical protein